VGTGLTLRYADGQVVVARVRPGSSAARADLRPGDALILLRGVPALYRLGRALRWRGWARLAAGLQYAASRVIISRPWYPDTPMPSERLVVERGGRRFSVILPGAREPELEQREFGLKRLDCGIGLLRVGSFVGARRRVWKHLRALLARARTTGLRGLILDLRGNRGGAQGLAATLVRHLIRRPVVIGYHRYLRSELLARHVPIIKSLAASPHDARWTVWVKEVLKPRPGTLALPVIALVDEVCASACETVARAIKAAPIGALYGRPTAGSSGLPVRIALPRSQLIITLPTWQSATHLRQPVEGHGVPPDRLIPLRRADLARGRDAPLEQARADLCRTLARTRPGR
jgi:carboxyl-terminal processing protease